MSLHSASRSIWALDGDGDPPVSQITPGALGTQVSLLCSKASPIGPPFVVSVSVVRSPISTEPPNYRQTRRDRQKLPERIKCEGKWAEA